MRIKRTTQTADSGTRTTSRGRMLAAASGLAAAVALALPGSATADSPADFTVSELQAVSQAVETADVAGTAWSVDAKTDTVELLVDSTVTKGELAEIREAAGAGAAAIEVEHVPGEFTRYIRGGDPIYTGGGRCSLGFNVQGGAYALTAGHCTNIGSSWSNSAGTTFGSTVYSSFPTNDYGYIQHNGAESTPSAVNCNGSIYTITGAANAYNGMSVTRDGSTTGCWSGSVTGLNQTVNYGGGDIVYGMIRTNICAEPGDSGGSLFSGSQAVGLTSGGSGNCSVGGTTFYQPVVEALNNHGISLP